MSTTAPPDGVRVTYSQQYRRCGKAGCSHCGPGRRGHGPYWYASWRENGRKRSRYLGTRAPAAVAVPPDPLSASPLYAPAPPLRVRTLGSFAVWRGEELLPPTAWGSQRAATLFKCLLSAPGHRLQREEASEALWPEGEPAASAANLRTTIHRLRRALDGGHGAASHLLLDGAALVLTPGNAGSGAPDEEWLDAAAFAHAARTALAGQDAEACQIALALYGGDYLPDDAYADWAAPTRVALRQQYLAVALHLAALCGARGELEEAESCLRQALAVDPGHEEAAAALMTLLAASGQRGAALRVYQALATTLEDELDVTPSAEIMALRARLVAQEAVPAGPPRRRVHPISRTNVPTPSSSFVGRAWEVGEIGDLLATSRLLTLTGPGGCGKTRLALEVAATRVQVYPDGVWLVELAALTDPAQAPRAVAAALGITERPGQPLRVTLGAFLQPRDLLLVVDNCEHLLGACATLVAGLLADCPHLRVLATSREGLAVAGERTYLVPSLATPDPVHPPAPEGLAAYEAVALFLERAQARRPALRLTAANAGAVAQICARLDGLPLAIELAAARVGVLPVEGIAARLDDRFRLLTGGARTALPRQQTLRATIDWSYALLDPAERRLMQRLAVFVGGWTLDAAEEVCGADSGAEGAVLDLLSALVDKSLVQAREEDGAVRYGFLETLRAYAQERLEASGDHEHAARRHAAYYLALAEQAEPALWGPRQISWFRRLAAEQDNLRAAIEWALAHDEITLGLRLAGALWRFWMYQGDYGGWRRMIEAGLARETGAPVPAQVRVKALNAAGWLAFHQWEYAATAALGAQSLRLARAQGDPLIVRGALVVLAKGAYGLGRQAEAIALFDEALDICRTLGDTPFLAPLLTSLSLALAKAGQGARAEGLMEEALALLREQGETYVAAQSARSLGHMVLARGEGERAAALFRESLRLSARTGHKQGLAESLEGIAAVCGAARQAEQAARLCAAADALRDATDQPLHPDDRVTLAPYLAAARAQLGDVAWAAAWAEGRVLPLESAITEAADVRLTGSTEKRT